MFKIMSHFNAFKYGGSVLFACLIPVHALLALVKVRTRYKDRNSGQTEYRACLAPIPCMGMRA